MPGRRSSNAAENANYASSSSTHTSKSFELQAATNELRKGKSESSERRRIQNRINQRAFRARQKSGEMVRNRGIRDWHVLGSSHEERKSVQASHEDFESERMRMSHSGSNTFTAATPVISTMRSPDLDTSNVWDDLAVLINSNFLGAIEENARQVGITTATLHGGSMHVLARASTPLSTPPSLWPHELQFHVPHDLIIDVIPHMQLRSNILAAVNDGALNQSEFCAALRASGSLENVAGQWLRNGMVVWNSVPTQASNWEISDAVWCKWGFLFRGCQDLIDGTNMWRAGRGDPALR